MQPFEIIKQIETTDSKTEKQRILNEQAKLGNDDLFAGIRMAYDQMITFGVKKVLHRGEVKKGEAQPRGLKFRAFATLAQKLANRELTGDAAQVAINSARLQATADEWDGWYRRILIKDMKAGFSESTVNKAVTGVNDKYIVPVFECQLAKDCVDDDGNIDESLFKGIKQIDVKMDGMRCLTFVYPATGEVIQYSRNGKELLNFGVIKQQIAKVAKFFSVPTVLDGEVMGASFQDLMKQSRRKTDVQADDSVLNLFDIITVEEFLAGKGKHRQIDRSYSLAMWYEQLKDQMPNVNVIGNELVDLDTPEGQARLMEINKAALAGKYEGVMLKDPEAPYECKRSLNWMKMKPFIEESLTVLDIEEGKPDSKFVGMMGAIVFGGVVDSKLVKVNCGSGFSIKQRAQIWADFTGKPVEWKQKVRGKWVTNVEQPTGTQYIGMVGEVRADCLTKPQEGDVWSMRFPRFKCWRGFAVGEKL